MNLKPIYIPFGGIFPALTSFVGSKEPLENHFPKIDQNTLYGQAHKGASAIDRRIGNLHLIMHRMRINSGVKLLSQEKNSMNFLYLPIDFESFFIWLRMIMDQIAFLTPLFYERQGIIPTGSFNAQLKWFTKTRPDFDKKYSEYLQANMSWFTEMRDIRDDSLHRHFWSYVELKNTGEFTVKHMRGNKLVREIASLSKTIGEFYFNFVKFSKYYERHFSKVLKVRDSQFKFNDQHVKMLEEYFVSLDYFLKKVR